jgi:hypothetical protein
VGLGQLVAKQLEPNRGVCLTLSPEVSYAFTTYNDAGLPGFRCFGGCFNNVTDGSEESNGIRQIIHHDRRYRFGDIDRNVGSLSNGAPDIHAVFLQSLKKAGSVWFRRQNDRRIPVIQSGFYSTSKDV